MSDLHQNDQNDFMIEKIKQRPVNKKKLLRRTIITASMAVIFGLIACFTFLILEPVISNFLYPKEEPQIVVFPEDQEEMSPEEMLAENMELENQNNQNTQPEMPTGNMMLEKEQIQEILSNVSLDIGNYKQLYNAMSEYVNELNQFMVTVTGVTSNVDWFNNVEESENISSGVIVANNGRELLILVDYKPLEKAETLNLTFYNGSKVAASVKGVDSNTNLAVLSVELESIDPLFLENGLKIALLGSSNIKNIVGMPVVALGRPMGSSGSIGYGMISAANTLVTNADINYRILHTDIYGSTNAGGVLFNMQGQVIGIITTCKTASDMKNMITAYGITELKRNIEKISNGGKMAYLGIHGIDVTREAHEELNVPYGAYIMELDMDSPAMLAGILQGDVLTQLDDKVINNFNEYTNVLMQMKENDNVEITIMRQAQDEYKEMKFHVVVKEQE